MRKPIKITIEGLYINTQWKLILCRMFDFLIIKFLQSLKYKKQNIRILWLKCKFEGVTFYLDYKFDTLIFKSSKKAKNK